MAGLNLSVRTPVLAIDSSAEFSVSATCAVRLAYGIRRVCDANKRRQGAEAKKYKPDLEQTG